MSENKPDEHSVILGGDGKSRAPEQDGDQGEPGPASLDADEGDLMSLPIGTLLGERYEVIGKLGSGGFGIVYEARDREASGDVFAIKEYVPDLCVRHQGSRTVSPRLARDRQAFEDGLRAFVEEARTLRELDHANIIRVFHWFKQHGTAYIVMRRLRGQTLESRINNGDRLEGEAALKLTRDLLSSLHAVHGKGLLHRDISPSNVFVLEDGTPVLLDFGAARFAIGKVSQRLTAIARHGYTPREQYDEYGIEVQSPSTDFYALAATLYHAITLSKPISSVKRKRESDRLRPAVEAGAGYLPEAVLRTIDKALNIDQAERWQNASEWLAALEREVKPEQVPQTRGPAQWALIIGGFLFLGYFILTSQKISNAREELAAVREELEIAKRKLVSTQVDQKANAKELSNAELALTEVREELEIAKRNLARALRYQSVAAPYISRQKASECPATAKSFLGALPEFTEAKEYSWGATANSSACGATVWCYGPKDKDGDPYMVLAVSCADGRADTIRDTIRESLPSRLRVSLPPEAPDV